MSSTIYAQIIAEKLRIRSSTTKQKEIHFSLTENDFSSKILKRPGCGIYWFSDCIKEIHSKISEDTPDDHIQFALSLEKALENDKRFSLTQELYFMDKRLPECKSSSFTELLVKLDESGYVLFSMKHKEIPFCVTEKETWIEYQQNAEKIYANTWMPFLIHTASLKYNNS